MTQSSNHSTPDRSAQSAKRDPFLALANEIERNPWWVDSAGIWELPPEENDGLLTPAAPARKPRKPTLASVAKQASKAGIEVARYEVKPDGTVVVVTGASEQQQGNELDEWMAKHARETEGNS